MNLSELKKRREQNFLAHKKKKRAYYLKNKAKNEIDYEKELNSGDFLLKMKSIASKQKQYIDNRKESIIAKINDYKESKRAYY